MKETLFKKMMGFLVLLMLVSSLTGISAAGTIIISEEENDNGNFDVKNDLNLNDTLINGSDLNGSFVNGSDLNGSFVNGSDLNNTFINNSEELDGSWWDSFLDTVKDIFSIDKWKNLQNVPIGAILICTGAGIPITNELINVLTYIMKYNEDIKKIEKQLKNTKISENKKHELENELKVVDSKRNDQVKNLVFIITKNINDHPIEFVLHQILHIL